MAWFQTKLAMIDELFYLCVINTKSCKPNPLLPSPPKAFRRGCIESLRNEG